MASLEPAAQPGSPSVRIPITVGFCPGTTTPDPLSPQHDPLLVDSTQSIWLVVQAFRIVGSSISCRRPVAVEVALGCSSPKPATTIGVVFVGSDAFRLGR